MKTIKRKLLAAAKRVPTITMRNGDLPPLLDHCFINDLEIFPESSEAAREVWAMFSRLEGPPLVIAQMQQGKTNSVVATIYLFIRFCELNKIPFEIIYLNNIADNELRQQVERRLRMAGMESCVKSIHHAQIRNDKFEPDPKAVKRLIIVDECHLALGRNRPFHKFLQKFGIRYGESIDTWENKDTYVLSVSATPFAAVIRQKIAANAFGVVKLKLNENYYGLQNMWDAGRLRPADQVVRNGKVTAFFKGRMGEFLSYCDEFGPGCMLVRSIGKNSDSLAEFLKVHYPHISVVVVQCAPVNNMADLDWHLSHPSSRPTIIIIKGSLRAGKTLETTANIRLCIEPPNSKTDTVLQGIVGRNCGYEMNGGVNLRFADTFPIYCNIEKIQEALDFYKNVGTKNPHAIPDGIQNGVSAKFVDDVEAIVLSKREVKERVAKGGVVVSVISKWNINDGAKLIHTKNIRGIPTEKNEGKTRDRIFLVDGPNRCKDKPKHKESWKALMTEHPEYKGQYVVLVRRGVKANTNLNGLIRPPCILSLN